MKRTYWAFYWPLAITGVVGLLARQFQNGFLARFPSPEEELANWGVAGSVVAPFAATLIFVPQMVNVLARSGPARRRCLQFVAAVGAALGAVLGLAAFTWQGAWLVGRVFSLEGPALADVMSYLKLLAPLVPVHGLRHYYTGLLVQVRSTRLVTALNLVHLGTVIGVLFLGLELEWGAVATVAVGEIAAACLHLVLSTAAYFAVYRPPARPAHAGLSWAEAFAFFWPVAVTSLLFALSRPTIFAFARRGPGGAVVIAALKVAFDFGILFHNPINQFRHLFVTFGDRDRAGARRFMVRVMLVMTAAMVLVVATPLLGRALGDLMGVGPDVLAGARRALLVMCLVPGVVTMRNYFHGLLLLARRTRGMAAGAVARAVAIPAVCGAAYGVGAMGPAAGSAALVVGFAMEAIVPYLFFHEAAPTADPPAEA